MKEFIYVYDPGKKRDYASEMIFKLTLEIHDGDENIKRPDRILFYLDLIHMDKHQGISYTKQAERIATRLKTTQLVNNVDFLVDGNGVGEPVIDILRDKNITVIPINSHGGKSVRVEHEDFGNLFPNSEDGRLKVLKVVKEYHVPKLDLVDAGRIILEQNRLRVAAGINFAKDFREQLSDFKPQEGKRKGYLKFAAEHESVHDDLVLCFLMGSWWALNRKDRVATIDKNIYKPIKKNYNPLDYC
ncbi:MAG: hypothetical protein FWF38_00470 [Spirochaetaceae bacterium]|nr:hypothetical protein [Spirochaetaceae bacterium]